jgi:hypothetical protein
VDASGNLTATSGTFSGTITASNISGSSYTGGTAGSSGGYYNFDENGDVTIEGTITAKAGKIGPWHINSLGISSAENGGGVRIETEGLYTVGKDSTFASWDHIVSVAVSFNTSGGTLHTLSGHLSTGTYNSLGLDRFFATEGFYVGSGANGQKVAT